MALPAKRQRFVDEYLLDLNATQAAIRAGYAASGAATEGARLLRNAQVAAVIKKALGARADRVEVKADDVLRELLRIGMCDPARLFGEDGSLLAIAEMSEDARRSIASIEVEALYSGGGSDKCQVGTTTKVKFWDKPKSLELLGKHLKLFTEKVELTGKLTLEQLVMESYERDGEE